MTRAEQNRFKKALEAYVRDATASEAAAQKALGKTGIFTKSGKVSQRYGGQSARKSKVDAVGEGASTVHGAKGLTAA